MNTNSAIATDGRTPAVRIRTAHDADEHAHNLSEWQQLYDQLTPGRFQGELSELWLDGAQVFREYTSHAVRQSCVVWPDSFWFGVPCSSSNIKIDAKFIGDDTVALRPGSCDFELLTPDDFNILGVVVDADLLIDHMREVEHVDPSQKLTERRLLCVGAHARHRFSGFIQRTLQVMAQPQTVLQSPAAQRALQQSLLEHLAALLTAAGPEPQLSLSQRHRQQLVAAVREHVMAHHDENMSVPDLCRQFHVSRRTLHNCFFEVLGISPAAYLRNVRLNAVRRELKNPASLLTTVQDVAAAWGFWHLSQFAADYRKLFGERPSESLRYRTNA